ncbi:DUF962-domain-containing protein [Wallemia mellicola CBS 633.66]|uniref:DUF962-domain-containing protein n=1 Tax=Wallemia mellicola (strain ATCC MYA-4683 / CBS 633.66) TaxID=671144 RepID=I4Y6B4_WALMC|nr:DUF962-domain-containing protein [Wallemia mellicola CBS 633.66]EIM19506.1 DUF962-domain-containing protein [Wallemia mellicola CBS 633.66]|eukprot:XP_006960431.1 DUF962-domain-containing protein [Wallemia mellicola CBS 633.66]
MKVFDLESQLHFYFRYHKNTTNVNIHRICVPLILWSTFAILAKLSTTYAIILAAIYQTYYFILSISIGFTYLPIMTLMLLSRNYITSVYTLIFIHIISWIAQFYGHAKHEKRAPALLDNVAGAVFLAPLFVHIENLFSLGYYNNLQRNLHNRID